MSGEAGSFDALLLLSFGGPEGPDDVLPFLENVTRGRGIPRERLAEVGEHYDRFGGVSPINGQCRALLAAIRADFAEHGLDQDVYWGNRNWTPMLADTVREMTKAGVRRALVLTTSAYASYSGCRQYREDLARACAEVGPEAPEFAKLRHYFNHPGFVGPMVANTVAALRTLPEGPAQDTFLAFTTHSVPAAMNDTSGPAGGAYLAQHLEVARLVAEGVAAATGREHPWELVFQSRSGPPAQLWLEPDIADHLRGLRGRARAVAAVPIGFTSDHMEVRYDLDVVAAEVARVEGLAFVRVPTVGTAPEFVAAIRGLVLERLQEVPVARRPAAGRLGPDHDVCPAGCCPNLRARLPAAAGGD
jgi:ferrochelatase